MYNLFFIAWHTVGFICITNKNPIGKAFYLLCFFLSNIAALLCDIVIKLN